MTEIEIVKRETREKLLSYGYDEERVDSVVNSFWKVLRRYGGKAASVLTVDGLEIYLT